jgi:hypothetical protein
MGSRDIGTQQTRWFLGVRLAMVRGLSTSIGFTACVERPYRVGVKLAGSPEPAILAPKYFNAELITVQVTEYVTALIAARHLLCSLRITDVKAPAPAP